MFNQRTTELIEIIQATGNSCYICFIFSAIILVLRKLYGQILKRKPERKSFVIRWMNSLWYWCKWPALAFLILDPFFHLVLGQKMDVWYWLFEALGFYNWYSYKDAGDDDDEWKKTVKKAKEKVAQIGGKLTVVPEST